MEHLRELFRKQQEHFYAVVKKSGHRDRLSKLEKIWNWVTTHQEKIRKAGHADFGRPAQEVDSTDIWPVLSEIRDARTHLRYWMQPVSVPAPMALLGTRSRIVKEPKGVCLILAPWNYPFQLCIGPLVSAIAAGNCAILKPSEHVPQTSALIAEMIGELFPPEEVAVVHGDHEVGNALVNLPFDHIFFTGSPEVGQTVMRAAAANLTSLTLELGGCNPAIVEETANLRDAARKLCLGKFFNAGQSCVSPNHVYVHASVLEPLKREIIREIESTWGDPVRALSNPAYTRIVDSRHLLRLQVLLDQFRKAGAGIEYGGVFNESQKYLSPTLCVFPDAHTEVRDEVFGPVMILVPYTSLDEVIGIINRGNKPLALYVFSRNAATIDKVISETSSGGACINETSIHFLHTGLPFGGVNHSGIGKAHGYAGFMAFTNEKPVLRNRIGFNSVSLIAPPYGKLQNFVLKVLLKWL